MRALFPLLLFCLTGLFLVAQQPYFPCGNTGGRSEWLKKYQADPEAYPKNLDTVLYVPLSIHLVGTDEGTNHLSMDRLLDALCRLNEDFGESNIRFFIEGDVHYYDNSDWYVHETVIDGANMMFENNIENTINCYFVADPAGTGGYNLPYAGIAVRNSLANAGAHTWAHEIGHALSIQHPFLGWEGGVSHDNSVPHDFNDPAPTHVTYNYTYFQDTLILDTLIIDTALVETVDGGNCYFAADGFCDTSPDYLALGWFCNTGGQSNLQQTDPNGETFRSDGSLIMNYAADNCQARFTPEQIGAMRANLYDEKPELLYNQTPADTLPAEPLVQLFPEEGDIVPPEEVYLEWEPVGNTAQYLLQISLLPNFSPFVTDTYLLTGFWTNVPDLLPERKYYWRVRPFNSHQFCTPFGLDRSFNTGSVTTSLREVSTSQVFRLYPNPVGADRQVMLSAVNTGTSALSTITLHDLNGRRLSDLAMEHTGNGAVRLRLPADLPRGMYVLRWGNGTGAGFVKLVID